MVNFDVPRLATPLPASLLEKSRARVLRKSVENRSFEQERHTRPTQRCATKVPQILRVLSTSVLQESQARESHKSVLEDP